MFFLSIPIILYILSGICDAIMDTIKDHFSISIFSKLNEQYWNPIISWRNKYVNGDPQKGFIKITILGVKFTKHVAFTDAWHLFKSIREVLIGLAITSGIYFGLHFNFLYSVIFLIVLGVLRNVFFSLFYDKILRK